MNCFFMYCDLNNGLVKVHNSDGSVIQVSGILIPTVLANRQGSFSKANNLKLAKKKCFRCSQ